MYFEIVSKISNIEVIALGQSIRDLDRLTRKYGPGRWRKLKGKAEVKLIDGAIHSAEIHWYEAHGIGKKRVKIKQFLD
jgi:hypothetical protein